jgi:hypothetical protein
VIGWSTSNGSASAGGDYAAAADQLTFTPGGANSQSIAIAISGDTLNEGNETLNVNLTIQSGNALLVDPVSQGTIVNDGTPLAVSDATVTDGVCSHVHGVVGVCQHLTCLGQL